jgi:4-aminobutyrate aminotransferase-like enzyme
MTNDVTPVIWYPGYEISPVHIESGMNCYLYDRNGKRYVDLESGVWCTSLGHSNPFYQAIDPHPKAYRYPDNKAISTTSANITSTSAIQ